MHRGKDSGTNYIRRFPEFEKWINVCIYCGQSGYDPDMPYVLTRNWGQGEFETVGASNIRKYFKPMRVNELGICEDCQKVESMRKKEN